MYFGYPAEVERIRDVAEKWRVPMVEDAAEALGKLEKRDSLRALGTVGTLSFNGNKLITTGEGVH